MENQRIRLSKAMLKNAFIDLLQEKTIEKITIYELCGRAQINRVTFYKYYGNQYDLLADIEKDCLNELEKFFTENDVSKALALKKILEYILSEKTRYKVLLNVVADKNFPEKLFGLPIIHKLVDRRFSAGYPKKYVEYVHLFLCHGGFAIILKWLNDENPAPPEEIADLITLIFNGFHEPAL